MFWWFERGGAFTRFEVLELSAGGFELRLVHPDGSEHVEHFGDAETLAHRQQAVQQQLKDKGWTGPHGWVI